MNLSPLFISFQVAVPAALIAFVLGTWAAYGVTRLRRLRSLVDGLLILPMVLPPTVVGYFLLLIFGRNGLLGAALFRAGMSVVFTRRGAVIAACAVSFPLMYRAARGAFEQLDDNLIHAGRTLGLRERTIFWRLMLPLCWPGIAAGAVLAFARALGEYGATSMLAGNIPGKTQTMSLAIAAAVAGGDRDKARLWAWIIMGMSLMSLLALNLLTRGRRRSGEAKGHAA